LTFYGDKFCTDSKSFIVEAMDSNAGVRRQSPQLPRRGV